MLKHRPNPRTATFRCFVAVIGDSDENFAFLLRTDKVPEVAVQFFPSQTVHRSCGNIIFNERSVNRPRTDCLIQQTVPRDSFIMDRNNADFDCMNFDNLFGWTTDFLIAIF